jgi:hypothetical protein
MSEWTNRANWPGGGEDHRHDHRRDHRRNRGTGNTGGRRTAWENQLTPSSGELVESAVQDPLDQLGIDPDGNLIMPGFPPQLSAPGNIATSECTPYQEFTAVVKLYTQFSQLLLLYVEPFQYSNTVFLKDLCRPLHFILTDCFGIKFAFRASFRELLAPRLGFAYQYPFDVVLHIESKIHVLNPEDFRRHYHYEPRRHPKTPHETESEYPR